MGITTKELTEMKEAIEKAANPLFFFDGDTDGLASFTLLYKLKGEGRGVMISGRPLLTEDYLKKIDYYQPDLVVILDLATITQEFIDGIKVPVYWLDHHQPNNEIRLPKNFHYLNPRLKDPEDGRPTSYWAYQIAKKDLWVAMTGIIGDYYYLLVDELRKEYPDLLPEEITDQGQALFNSPLGELIRIINFNLKGAVRECMTSVKIFTRIESPYEILRQETPRGRYLWKKAQKVMKEYELLLKRAEENIKQEEPIILLGELANELKVKNPDKIVIVGRKNDERIIMSIRGEKKEVLGPLQEALKGVNGYGGGHPKACGASVEEKDFEKFLEQFKKAIKE